MNTKNAIMQVVNICLKVAVLIAIVLGIFYLSQMAYTYGHDIFYQHAMDEAPGRDVAVQIGESTTEKELGKLLERKGLVEDATVFRIQLKLSDYKDSIKAGTYVLNTSMTPKEMMKVLAGEGAEDET